MLSFHATSTPPLASKATTTGWRQLSNDDAASRLQFRYYAFCPASPSRYYWLSQGLSMPLEYCSETADDLSLRDYAYYSLIEIHCITITPLAMLLRFHRLLTFLMMHFSCLFRHL
jgi:hypothetical protein